jgi:hypothetical protein
VLTGIIDRNIETVGDGDSAKRYATDAVRKLYFRGTPEIDAGGRFAADAVPEYIVFDKPNMAADFIRVIEEGMEKSKTTFACTDSATTVAKKPAKVEPVTVVADKDVEDDQLYDDVAEDVDDAPFDIDDEPSVDELMADIRAAFKTANADTKASVKAVLSSNGATKLDASLGIDVLKEIKAILN